MGGGDDVQVDETFNSNAATLAYDDNGNLTDDGVYKFVYDAWNRMVQVKRRPDAATTIATYAYDAVNRRQSKIVTNCGIENTAGDGGDTTVHFYYGSATGGIGGTGILAGGSVPWNIFETRNGSNQTTRQWCWGTQYIDEILFMDVNGDPSADNDADIDVTAGGESGESPADKRYFYHQDRNWNVVALTEYSPPGLPSNVSGRVAERYAYTPYGEFVVLTGDSGNGEMGAQRKASGVAHPIVHQALPLDSGLASCRQRQYVTCYGRFQQREPQRGAYALVDGANLYLAYRCLPTAATDPSGLCSIRWRRNQIFGGKYHAGLDIDGDSDGRSDAVDGHLDYALQYEGMQLCCRNNYRFRNRAPRPEDDNDVWRAPPNGTHCLCECLKRHTPEQVGECRDYMFLGTPPFSNSNSGLSRAVSGCERYCNEPLPRPVWVNDAVLPGWDRGLHISGGTRDMDCLGQPTTWPPTPR